MPSTADSLDLEDPPTDADSGIVGALAFNEDRTDDETLWFRYVTIAREYRGEGIGPKLIIHVREVAFERGYERIRIAVNNPFAYDALWKAGFTFTGDTTGIAELILECERTASLSPDLPQYRVGLEQFLERDLSADEDTFLERRLERGAPDRLD